MISVKNLIKKYGHIWTLSYAFIYLPWFIYLEKTVTRNYNLMHIPLDDYIPFSEYFIIPYFLWFVYVIAAFIYFFFTNKQDYYKLCIFLFTGMTISLIVCTLYPNGTALRPTVDPGKNIFTKMVYYLYQTDTCANVFPSIHVFNSIGVHFAVRNSETLKKYKTVQFGSGLLMVAICLSTVYLKQHSCIDGFASILMAAILYPFIYNSAYAATYGKRKFARRISNL